MEQDFDRQEYIRSKGFDMFTQQERNLHEVPENYGSIKTGAKTLEDAVLNLGSITAVKRKYRDKGLIYKAIAENNRPLMREISNYYYRTNGIYMRLCDYFAKMYRYDWYIVPEIMEDVTEKNQEKYMTEFKRLLSFLDNSHIKRYCGETALKVIKNGAYYGYIIPNKDGLIVQELPVSYCRSIYDYRDRPAVEFNMRFFDDCFRSVDYRMKVLKMFPKEFQRGYLLYKTGKLEPDREHTDITEWAPYGDGLGRLRAGCWYMLDPESTVKLNFLPNDQPMFINVIPALIDLDMAQDLDRRKQMQDLLKIVIQQLPLDKNGDLIFDVDEARDIHNNAVEMLQHAIGVDVLTTFADIKVESMKDKSTSTTSDDLEKMERTVYNNSGSSHNIFNSDSNLALQTSLANDESMVRELKLQLEEFFDRVTQQLSLNKKKCNYRFHMLDTTQYNYQTLSKMYKEQVQLGYSKMLPEISLGHSQSEIVHMAYFENQVLKLSEIMIPPLMSSTLNAESILGGGNQTSQSKSQNKTGSATKTASGDSKSVGRPEKEDSQKSEKTIANKESM